MRPAQGQAILLGIRAGTHCFGVAVLGVLMFLVGGIGDDVMVVLDDATSEGYDLQDCYAYSDSISDLPMLERVAAARDGTGDRIMGDPWVA